MVLFFYKTYFWVWHDGRSISIRPHAFYALVLLFFRFIGQGHITSALDPARVFQGVTAGRESGCKCQVSTQNGLMMMTCYLFPRH